MPISTAASGTVPISAVSTAISVVVVSADLTPTVKKKKRTIIESYV